MKSKNTQDNNITYLKKLDDFFISNTETKHETKFNRQYYNIDETDLLSTNPQQSLDDYDLPKIKKHKKPTNRSGIIAIMGSYLN